MIDARITYEPATCNHAALAVGRWRGLALELRNLLVHALQHQLLDQAVVGLDVLRSQSDRRVVELEYELLVIGRVDHVQRTDIEALRSGGSNNQHQLARSCPRTRRIDSNVLRTCGRIARSTPCTGR